MKTLIRSTYRITVLIFLVIFTVLITGIILGNIYREEIRKFAIAEINRGIDVRVNISSSDLSVWRKFPYISLVLKDAVAFSSSDFDRTLFETGSGDTLFTSSRIYLQFNLIDIVKGNYRLKKVHAVDGMINLLADQNGKINYLFSKAGKESAGKEFTLELAAVKLTSFRWQYLNLATNVSSKGQVKDLALKGKFSESSFSLSAVSSLYLESLISGGKEYASSLDLAGRFILEVQDSVYHIKKGDILLENMGFKSAGTLVFGLKTFLDIKIAGKDLEVTSLVHSLPFDKEEIVKYSPAGKIQLLAKVSGEISSTRYPLVRAAFQLEDGKVFIPGQGDYISGIGLKGTYSNGSAHNAATSRLNLSEFSVKYGTNLLTGNLSVDNFNSPTVEASLSGSILAKDFSGILDNPDLKFTGGTIYPEFSLKLKLNSFSNFEPGNVLPGSLSGRIGLKEISGKIPGPDLPLYLLEGNIRMDGSDWQPELRMILGKNRVNANLDIKYLFEFLTDKSKIPVISGNIFSEYLVLPDFFPESDSVERTDFHLPDSIYLDLNCKVDSFVYGKFLASDLESSFGYKPGLLNVTFLKMKTMKGSAAVTGAIIGDNEGKMLLRASGELKKIDITQLFYAMGNFGQDFIVSENLKGSVSGKLDFSTFISPGLDLLTKDLYAQSDFVIDQGELIDFEPITELSDFVELSELQHIRFSTLQNSILIRDEKVYIPQMDIKSSAFNLSISGTHGFDNYFEYKMKLNLSEYLASKASKAKKENEEFGIVEKGEEGGTNLYLSIKGTPEDFKIRYDKKEAVIKIKSDLQQEKKVLRSILNEEFGLFKKDSLNSNTFDNGSEKKQFIMDWGEENTKITEPEKTVTKKKKEPEFVITWDEEGPDN